MNFFEPFYMLIYNTDIVYLGGQILFDDTIQPQKRIGYTLRQASVFIDGKRFDIVFRCYKSGPCTISRVLDGNSKAFFNTVRTLIWDKDNDYITYMLLRKVKQLGLVLLYIALLICSFVFFEKFLHSLWIIHLVISVVSLILFVLFCCAKLLTRLRCLVYDEYMECIDEYQDRISDGFL